MLGWLVETLAAMATGVLGVVALCWLAAEAPDWVSRLVRGK